MKKLFLFILASYILLLHDLTGTGLQLTYTPQEQAEVTQRYEYYMSRLMTHLISAHARNKPEEATRIYATITHLSQTIMIYAQTAKKYNNHPISVRQGPLRLRTGNRKKCNVRIHS